MAVMKTDKGEHEFHVLKTWVKYFQAIVEEDVLKRKTVEIRKNDRNYRVGDILILKEYDHIHDEFTGREVWRLVTHILNEQPWVPDGFVAMSITETMPIKF